MDSIETTTEPTGLSSLSAQKAAGLDEGTTSTPATEVPPESTPEKIAQPSETPPPYSPNYKFKVKDKEFEIDEFVRGAVKDADTERKLKELYEKAYGIDEVKKHRDQIRDEYKSYKSEYEPVIKKVESAFKAFAAKDLDLFFSEIGVPESVLQQHVLKKLQFQDLPQEQKDLYNKEQELRRQNMTLQEKLQSFESQFQSSMVAQRERELESALLDPRAQAFRQSFDSRNGEGSFKNEIIQLGAFKWQTAKKDISPSELISEILSKYDVPTTQVSQSQPTQPIDSAAKKDVPVIPVVKSGSASPSHKKITSINDLRAAAKEIGAT